MQWMAAGSRHCEEAFSAGEAILPRSLRAGVLRLLRASQ
jgi:hypothetical protein